MIENPFVFGRAAEGPYFTDRGEDSKRLYANLTHGVNTILISPRRWGKTSLVKKVIETINSKESKTIFIDLSSYVQQLSWLVWYKTDKVVQNKDIDDAINDLLEQNKLFFQREVESLTEYQMNFLIALANGITTGFSRKEVINKYRLESSANIQSVKKSLVKKDLIDVDGQKVSFDDSLFKLWIRRQNW